MGKYGRTVVTLLVAIAAIGGLAIGQASQANASTHPHRVPIAANGKVCLKRDHHRGLAFDSARPDGHAVVTIACNKSRELFWVQAGIDGQGVPFGYIETYLGYPIAALDCLGVSGGIQVVQSRSDNGTVWSRFVFSNNNEHYYANRRCSGGAKRYSCVLSTQDHDDWPWGINQLYSDPGHSQCFPDSGYFNSLNFIGDPTFSPVGAKPHTESAVLTLHGRISYGTSGLCLTSTGVGQSPEMTNCSSGFNALQEWVLGDTLCRWDTSNCISLAGNGVMTLESGQGTIGFQYNTGNTITGPISSGTGYLTTNGQKNSVPDFEAAGGSGETPWYYFTTGSKPKTTTTAALVGYQQPKTHVACNMIVTGAPSSNGRRFRTSAYQNTCNDRQRAWSGCLPRAGNGVHELGPWVSGTSTSTTPDCPSNMTMVVAGTQYPYNDRHTYCLWSCSDRAKTGSEVVKVPARGNRIGCTSHYDWAFLTQLHNDEQGGYADWESNACDFTMQTRVECTNPAGADYYHYSGEVKGLEQQDWASCNLFDTAIKFWIDPQDTNHWVRLA